MKITDPFERSEKLGRPMSPHLSIYAWQLTNTMSIMNRATGVAMGLVFYDYFASYALMPGMMAASSVVPFAAGLPAILFVGKAGLAFSFWYHLFGGIRHWVGFWKSGGRWSFRTLFSDVPLLPFLLIRSGTWDTCLTSREFTALATPPLLPLA